MYLYIFLGAIIACFLYYTYSVTLYWKKRRVTHIKSWPVVGSLPSNLLRKRTMPEQFQLMYNMYPNAKYVGLHQFMNPILMIRDPELIKQITVKDFDFFMNHQVLITEENEPLFGKNLLSLKGQKWKDMRSTLSPAFTSSKMRTMFVLITECAEQFVNYFMKEAQMKNQMVTVEMKDIFTRYTNDVIATAAFGIKCDSLEDKENEFYMIGKKSTEFKLLSLLKAFAFMLMPNIMKLTGITFMDKTVTNYFRDTILTTLKIREEQGIIRPDMIHLLMEAKKGKLKHDQGSTDETEFSAVHDSSSKQAQKDDIPALTNEDIVAQAFLFFFAGYDTGSTLMSFMAYELAINPDIQKKLLEEVDEVFAGGKVDYESILKMKYLDMVVSESLRKWPPAVLTERVCDKNYDVPIVNDNEESPTIEKDISVWFPVYAIHHDEKYYPEPERFDPERFSDENKNSIAPFTYLPFGAGPRNCIGSRFALLEIKVLFVYILSKLEFTVVKETQVPLKLSKTKLNMTAENGIWVGLKLRK